MKKLFVSAGLIAAGAASVQSVNSQGSDAVSPKAWSVGASLRGFYDDNYLYSSSKRGSFGSELSPSISYNLPLRQSDMGIRYNYSLYYYQDRQDQRGDVNPFDQSHQVDFWFDHAFNENWHFNFTDTFGDGQQPELLQPNIALGNATPFRVNGNNLANHANLSLATQWTRELGTTLHYGNDFYDYHNQGATAPLNPAPTGPIFLYGPSASLPGINGYSQLSAGGASLAGLLDRDEQHIGFDVDWTFSPELTVMAGYSFGIVNYTGKEPISVYNYNVGGILFGGTIIGGQPRSLIRYSDSRDSMSHNIYVGGSWTINPNLTLLATIGAEYTDSYNDPLNHDTSVAPTANVSISYTYATGSYLQLGVAQSQNATDQVNADAGGNIAQYQNTSVVYADVNHRITSKLMGTLIGRYQYSTYEGGAYTAGDNDFNVGVNLSYQISQHWNAEVGYNYDDLQSSIPGVQYDRNEVYLGVGATY
jgi:hypothetical protein